MTFNTREVWNVTTKDVESEEHLKAVYASPIPTVGTTEYGLLALPTSADNVATNYSKKYRMTNWNTHCVSFPLSVQFALETNPSSVQSNRVVSEHSHEHIRPSDLYMPLQEAQRYMREHPNRFGDEDILSINLGKMHLTHVGVGRTNEAISRRKQPFTVRSFYQDVVYGSGAEEGEFEVVRESANDATASRATRGRSSQRRAAIVAETSTSQSPGQNVVTKSIAFPTYIPVARVQTLKTLAMTESAERPTWGAAATALQLRMDSRDTVVNTVAPTTRSGVVRDTSVISTLMSQCGRTNDSWIDTAYFLKALLYCFPFPPDARTVDKSWRLFMRNEKMDQTVKKDVLFTGITTAQLGSRKIKLCAVTLTAFADIYDGIDPIMSAPVDGNNALARWRRSGMDTTWTVVPMSSTLLNMPWTFEYLIPFLPSNLWAGRLNWVDKAAYPVDGSTQYRTYRASMPRSHCVDIPGFDNLMIVLVEDQQFVRSSSIRISGIADPIKVWTGGRHGQHNDTTTANWGGRYELDITTSVMNALGGTSYQRTAEKIQASLVYTERLLSRNGAFRMALSLAAEMSAGTHYGMSRRYSHTHSGYETTARGGWSFKEADLPYNVSVSGWFNADKEAESKKNYVQLCHAFMFSSLTAMGKHYSAFVECEATEVDVDSKKDKAQYITWKRTSDTDATYSFYGTTQYQCHTASSIYRILNSMELTIGDAFRYEIHSLAGLQTTTYLQSVALSLAAIRFLRRNDLSMRWWVGYDEDDNYSSRLTVSKITYRLTFNTILHSNPVVLLNDDKLDLETALTRYYSYDWTESLWGNCWPVPYNVSQSWEQHFSDPNLVVKVSPAIIYKSGDSVIGGLTVTITEDNQDVLPFLAGSMDVHRNSPAVCENRALIENLLHDQSCEPWIDITEVNRHGYSDTNVWTTNTLLLSLKYHYVSTHNVSTIAILNNKLPAISHSTELLSTSPSHYPDPKVFVPRRPDQPAPATSGPVSSGQGGSSNLILRHDTSSGPSNIPTLTIVPMTAPASEEAVSMAKDSTRNDLSHRITASELASVSDADQAAAQNI